MSRTYTNRPAQKRIFNGKRRFEHWYRDNQIYFITARCRDRFPAFATDEAKATFWSKFDQYAEVPGFTPIVTTLVPNHYHTLGYLRRGNELGPMMRHLHGSVAKLANDLLPERHVPFWHDVKGKDYFDGCIRDELQMRRAFRYTYGQCVRHHVCVDPGRYADTRVNVALEAAVRRAIELNALLVNVPYKRYQKSHSRPGH